MLAVFCTGPFLRYSLAATTTVKAAPKRQFSKMQLKLRNWLQLLRCTSRRWIRVFRFRSSVTSLHRRRPELGKGVRGKVMRQSEFLKLLQKVFIIYWLINACPNCNQFMIVYDFWPIWFNNQGWELVSLSHCEKLSRFSAFRIFGKMQEFFFFFVVFLKTAQIRPEKVNFFKKRCENSRAFWGFASCFLKIDLQHPWYIYDFL